MFGDLGIRVVSGGRFLSGYIGESGLTADFVSNKVQLWLRCVQHLSNVTISQPRLLMQHWQGPYNLNGVIFKELYLTVRLFLLHFKWLYVPNSTLHYLMVQFLNMRYVCLLCQLDLVAWVLVIRWNPLCWHFHLLGKVPQY